MGKIRKLMRPLKKAYVENMINKERKYEEYLILKNYPKDSFTPLTDDEKKKVYDLWGTFSSHISLKEYEVYKKVNGFDERFLSHELYLPIISHLLNDYHYTKFIEDKGLLGYLLKSDYLKFPNCFVRCINGEFYDNSMHQLSKDEALKYCAEQDEFIIKISRESSGGHGVSKISLVGKSFAERLDICKNQFKKYGEYFVVQECIKQHALMSRFNATSINTFRVTTLYLNKKVSVLSIILRIGKAGSFVDNMGSGGVGVGVLPNGKLNEFGYTYSLNKVYSHNDVLFKDECIPQVPSMLDMITKAHKDVFPLCKLIGWDICIDSTGRFIVIEVNSSQPGISGEQMNCGPIFGDRTQEVIEFCKGRKFRYNKSVFSY